MYDISRFFIDKNTIHYYRNLGINIVTENVYTMCNWRFFISFQLSISVLVFV